MGKKSQDYNLAKIESKWPFDSAQGKQEYDPSAIEKKWQGVWTKSGIYKTPSGPKNKKYILDMFPYPSGATMHVGHLEGYVGTDIISRYERMKGSAVLHPMGWDSFGLPAENYAIETGIHPYESTHKNIETFKRQLNITGLSYDWEREIDTSSPEYYKWNQWLFILLYKRGLAYKKKSAANWCPSCETVLANEQVVNGRCERCAAEVVQKEIDQWFLKITEYADRLISGLDHIDWLEEVKVQQKNWIGKSEGIEIRFKVDDLSKAWPSRLRFKNEEIVAYTKFPETIFGVTFMVIAPEHPLVNKLTTREQSETVEEYIRHSQKKSALEREALEKDKTGVFIGSYCINPVNGEKVPIWVGDYVIAAYGTGAVMGVPGSDHRDFAFAKKYDLPIVRVIGKAKGDTSPVETDEDVLEDGFIVNSGEFDGLQAQYPAKEIFKNWLEKKRYGRKKIQYHLRDWTISRQRYWGTPIPMIYCEKCNWQPVEASALPVKLPKDVDFKPTGESPIARSKSFQANVVCPKCGGSARREVDTMDTYFDSSWYFIRFVDPKNRRAFASQKAIKSWLPVDVYVGGGHEVQHLLFARFFWKVLFDAGLIDKSLGDEPFLKLRAPGWILGPDSRKMSKRWNNVITPDDIVPKYGADTLRLYEMFMGPFEAMKPWSITGVNGVHRFVKKIWTLFEETRAETKQEGDRKASVLVNRLVKKVGEDIPSMNFNTAISGMMETYNSLIKMRERGVGINWEEVWEKFLLVLAPFVPHLAEELWSKMGHSKSIHLESWPKYDLMLIQEEEVTIPVQVDGKLRDVIIMQSERGKVQSGVEKVAKESNKVAKYLEGEKISKVIFIPGRLINFVTK